MLVVFLPVVLFLQILAQFIEFMVVALCAQDYITSKNTSILCKFKIPPSIGSRAGSEIDNFWPH